MTEFSPGIERVVKLDPCSVKVKSRSNSPQFLCCSNNLIPESGQYFNYMGMLAVEGSYDKMEALLSGDIHPVDVLLLMAASEGDKPKIEELMRAGARYDVTDGNGQTALERACSDDIREFILSFAATNAV